ncbi:MAG: hypothetical protein AB7L92_06605 [Alphaproteobacteria bacterium]
MIDWKEKKKKQAAKNRKDQEIFNLMRLRQQEAERVESEANSRKPKRSAESGDDPLWSEKVSTIRNRVTGSKRTSKERWNRFAGTSDGGGRGL